ncbi:MAG: beta-ketoacyl-[acyl-carrier-protein] synthase family protein [Kineosporiaceae bacterium]
MRSTIPAHDEGHGAPPVPRRVVITGIGTVSAMGRGVDTLLAGLREGRNCARPISAFDTTGFDYANACEVTAGEDDPPGDPDLGRAAGFAVEAARLAVNDAGLGGTTHDAGLGGTTPDAGLGGTTPAVDALATGRWAVAVGTTDGESRDLDDIVAQQLAGERAEDGEHAPDPATVARVQPLRLSAAIARGLGLERAEVLTLQTACAAGNYAIGYGFDAIRTGDADLALAGGADALCRKTFTGFFRLGTIAPDLCRPFDADRQGILTGEGATVLVLESLDGALARGARVYAEVLGYGLTCDATHPVAPDDAGVARCISVAHARAGLVPADIDLVSAHGTGTRANDVTESRALRAVFGEDVPRTISIKSMLGHSMGAASAIGAAASALALTHQFIPPTINHRETDPECAVDCVPNVSVPAHLSVVQNHGLAFGGNNSVLLLGRAEPEWAA